MVLRPLPLTRSDRLPAELMAQILDDASHDIQTLHACSLVCAAWRSYLIHSPYEEILLHSAPQFHRLVCAARIYPTIRDRLAPVRSIILQQDDMRGPGLVHVFPLMLGPYLHKVEHLSFKFRNSILQPLHPSFFVKLRQLKDIKRLELSITFLINLADFWRIVRSFPQLEELDLEHLQYLSWKPSQLTPSHLLNPPCVPKLTSVRMNRLDGNLFCDLVAWLSSGGVCSSIQRLDIYLDNWRAGPVNALLTHTASTLEHLRMRVTASRLDDHWNFPQFSHLCELDITLSYQMSAVLTKDVHRGLHSIFASLKSPALKRVRLVLECASSKPLSKQDMDWRDTTTDTDHAQYADLHAALAHPTFCSLHRVTVVLYNGRSRGVMPAEDQALEFSFFLRALLAPWCMRGIVSLACVIHDYVNKCLYAVVDEGKGLRSIKRSGGDYDWENPMAELEL